jgi:hypothetical protein
LSTPTLTLFEASAGTARARLAMAQTKKANGLDRNGRSSTSL